MKRKLSLILVLVMVLSLVTTGCAGSKDNVDNVIVTDSPNTENTPIAEQTNLKDSIIIGHWGDPPSLDPNNSLNDCSMRITTNVFDTLIRMDDKFQPQPCIAESWKISEDGLEYTFKIREGVKFHNGDTLTIDDVVFSIERGIATPKASPSYKRVESVEKVDDTHVKVILIGPFNPILANLALPFGPILSKSYVESIGDEEFASKPMGTGPYKFVEWVKGEKVILESNEDYFLGAPSIKRMEYRVIADTSAALISLESGDIDAYCDISTADYETAKANDNIRINEGVSLGYEYIQFNTAKAPFDDVRVRRAVVHALDKESMLIGVNDGIGTVVDTVVLEDAIGYTDDFSKYEYNLEKAKKLLKEAGYDKGFECDIYVSMDIYSKYAQILQASLLELKIKANIKFAELAAYKVALESGEYDMAIGGCSFTAMDVDEASADNIHSENIGSTNTTFYNNERVDELYDTALLTTDETARGKLYTEIIQIIAEDVPIMPIIWRVRNITAHKDLDIPFIDPYAFHFVYNWSWK